MLEVEQAGGRNKLCLVLFLGIVLISSILYLIIFMKFLFEASGYVIDEISTQTGESRLRFSEIGMKNRKPIKVFLLAYMRGGSSIAGELFNCDPSATMWYEPGAAFFSAYYGLSQGNFPQEDLYFSNMTRRKLDTVELDAMADYYLKIFSCNYKELPPEAMAHYFIRQSTAMDEYGKCRKRNRNKNITIVACKSHIEDICSKKQLEVSLREKCHIAIAAVKTTMEDYPSVRSETELLTLLQDHLNEQSIQLPHKHSDYLVQFIRHGLCIEQMREDNEKCINIAIGKCKRDELIVVQVNRMKMEDLENLIQSDPDIHVIHYTRDPRAVALSRLRTNWLMFDRENRSTVRELEYICHRMREDIRHRHILEKKYPNTFTHVSYESLAVDPIRFASRIYSMFNGTYPGAWRAFVAEHMFGDSDSGTFGITVRNATEKAFRWRSQISKDELDSINSFCSDVITELGYQL